jgi:hypothetical protein
MMIVINGNNDNNSNNNSNDNDNDNDNHYAADRSEHAEVRPIGAQHTPVAATRTRCSLLALARGPASHWLGGSCSSLRRRLARTSTRRGSRWVRPKAYKVARPTGRCPPQRVGVRDSLRAVVRLMRVCARASKRARLGRGCGV